jgi:hypothetical protein
MRFMGIECAEKVRDGRPVSTTAGPTVVSDWRSVVFLEMAVRKGTCPQPVRLARQPAAIVRAPGQS